MSDAKEILSRLRAENALATASSAVNTDGIYSRLLISKLRRRQLSFALGVAFIVFLAIIVKHQHIGAFWGVTALPIIALGLLLSAVPPTEQWEYRPWQAKARQYERHQIDP